MKFLDKVKNMFTEVVEEEPKNDEVVVEQIVTKKEKNIDTEEIKESKIPEPKKEEKKPIFFTDDDFNDLDDYFNKNSSNKKSEPVIEEKKKDKIKVEYTRSSTYNDNNKTSSELPKKDYDPLKSANDYLEKYNEENGGVKEPYQGNIKVETKPEVW